MNQPLELRDDIRKINSRGGHRMAVRDFLNTGGEAEGAIVHLSCVELLWFACPADRVDEHQSNNHLSV